MPEDRKILATLVRNMKRRGSDPLRPLVDAYLIERVAAADRYETPPYSLRPPVRPGGRFSPSDLCGCERAAGFKFLGMESRKRINPDRELIFDDGNWRHLKWESIFHDMERVLGSDRCHVVAIETRVMFPELYVAGALDAILMLRPTARSPRLKWLIDIKGINSRGFQHIIRNDAPIDKHVKQVVAYLRATGCKRGLLWYENKDTQETKAFIVRDDDDAWLEVESWATAVIHALNQRWLPPMHPECVRGTLTFERCPYARHCFGAVDDDDVRDLAYDGWQGIEAAWDQGHAEWGDET